MDTARTIITDALLDLGVLADEEVPTASQAVGALRKLNNLLEGWSIEKLMVYGSTPTVIPFVAGKQVYTIGPGGDFNISRPNFIDSAYVRNNTASVTNQLDTPLYVFNDDEWASVSFKGMQGSWPNIGVWFNYSFPLIQATLYPTPTTSQYSLVIWSEGQVGSFSLDTVITLPPGYKRAVTAALSIELAPSYEVQPSPATIQVAREAKSNLKVINFQLNELQTGGSTYDVLTNRYTGGGAAP